MSSKKFRNDFHDKYLCAKMGKLALAKSSNFMTPKKQYKTVEQHKRNTEKGKTSMDGHKWARLKRITTIGQSQNESA